MSDLTWTASIEYDPGDIQNLISHPDREVRAVIAQKICRQVRGLDLNDVERRTINEILAVISKDAAALVRRALAVTLKNSPNLPRDVAQRLIRDVDSIAVPILEYSPVLDDEDLLGVLRSKAAAKMLAISRRARISGELVQAIVRYGDRHAIASVAANDGAELGTSLGAQLVELYHDDDLIMESFISRQDLPSLVVEKMITAVSAETAVRLHELHEVPLDLALDIAKRTQERASIDFIAQSWVANDIPKLAERLDKEDRLTTSLILRAACCGQMRFVEAALAVRCGINLRKASLMVHDSGPIGLKTLCRNAGFNVQQTQLFHASSVIYRDLELSGRVANKHEFQSLMLERILSLPLQMDAETTDYCLEKLDRLYAD